MAGHFNWKELFTVEQFQLRQEGFLPDVEPEGDSAADYKRAYQALTDGRAFARVPEYAYVEPNALEEILKDADPPPRLAPLPESAYPDRVKGAWFGRCAGMVLGKPFEMNVGRQWIREYLESVDAWPLADYPPAESKALGRALLPNCLPCTRGNMRYVQSDDDIHYTILSLLLAEQHGAAFTPWQAGWNLIENIPLGQVWTSDRQLYYNLATLDPADDEAAQFQGIGARFNPWREGMCPYLKADFWGYITPGEPRKGAPMIHRLGALSAVKNGLYSGLFVQGCISAALSEAPTVETILAGGLCNVPRRSRLYEAVHTVMRWYRETPDWESVCDKIYERYGDWYFAGTINNLCFVTLALLAGELDYERTISVAVCCGTDTDCNAATAGSIAGAALGYEALPPKWIDPLNDSVHSFVAGFGWGSVSELALRTAKVRGEIRQA